MAFLVVSPNGERLASCATHLLAEWSCKSMVTRQTWILQRTAQSRSNPGHETPAWQVVGGFDRGVRVQASLYNHQLQSKQANDAAQHGRGSLCDSSIENGGGTEWEDLSSPGERFTV